MKIKRIVNVDMVYIVHHVKVFGECLLKCHCYISSEGGAYRLNFPFFHLVKEMYGKKVRQKWMDNEFKMATVDGWKMKV